MRKLGDSLQTFLAGYQADDEAARKARRAAVVLAKWRSAIEKVYKDAAPFVLSHVNAVYILRGEDPSEGKSLVVYADDSLVRSDIDARQEFIKMALRADGEDIASFKIIAATLGMRQRHPYASNDAVDGEKTALSPRRRRTLTPADLASIDECVSVIDDPRLRKTAKRAMIAEMENNDDF